MFTSDGYNSVDVISAVATGTHSAGKSTLVSDYFETLHDVGLIGGEEQGALHTFLAGSIVFQNIHIPVVAVPEAATLYAKETAKPELLTTGYTLEDQIRIELLADALGTDASLLSEQRFDELNPTHHGRRLAVLLSDRSGLDGAVYSRVRLPDSEQEQIDLADVMRKTGGYLIGVAPNIYLWRDCVRRAIANTDVAFMVNHTEVPFESSELRLEDQDFRNKIAVDIKKSYISVLGTDKVVDIHGSRAERVNLVQSRITSLLVNIVA